jgi:hypothetical protein
MISNAQKAVLHIAKSQLQLEDEMYRAILQENSGCSSSSDLTNTTFDQVMKRLEELGFKNTARRPRPRRQPHGAAMITADQQHLIKDLYEQLGWTEMPRQMGFSKRCCKKSFPQTRTDANKVIEGLKAIMKRENPT